MLRAESSRSKPLRLVSPDRSGLVRPGPSGAAVTSRYRMENSEPSIGTKHQQLVRIPGYRVDPDETINSNTSGPYSSKRFWSNATTATHPFLDTSDCFAGMVLQHLFPNSRLSSPSGRMQHQELVCIPIHRISLAGGSDNKTSVFSCVKPIQS